MKHITITLTEDQARGLKTALEAFREKAYGESNKAFLSRIITKINAELVQ